MVRENIRASLVGQNDMMNRLQVSLPHQTASYSNAFSVNPLFDYKGTGTFAYEDVDINGVAGVKMSVTAGQWVVAESKVVHGYVKCMPQTWEFTHQNFAKEVGVIKEVGYFSSSNTSPYNTELDGQYIESNGDDDDYFLCLRRKGVEIARVPRANWDDKLDGTGASGKTIDFTGFNIEKCSFVWLGGKGAIFGFSVDNVLVLAHSIGHAGVGAGLIFKSPNQPLRISIRSTTGVGHIYNICSAVQKEGSENDFGVPRAVPSTYNVRANSLSTTYGVIFIRLNSLFKNTVINFNSFSLSSVTSTDSFGTVVLANPTIANELSLVWVSHPNIQGLEYAYGEASNPSTTTLTGGVPISAVSTSDRTSSSGGDFDLNTLHQLTRDLDGDGIVIALGMTPLSTNIQAHGSINLTANHL